MAKIFISHASEDKANFVRPLAIKLMDHFQVWYDEFSLNLGDSLLKSIQRGISTSDFGLIVISPNFLKKPWPQRELDALFSLEVQKKTTILPVWHEVSATDVAEHLPIFAGRVAANSNEGTDAVVEKIKAAILARRDVTALNTDYELEIASNISTNEIVGREGALIKHENIMLFRALKDGITRHIEHFSTDGYIDNFHTSGGKISSVDIEEQVYYVTTEFADVISRSSWSERTLTCDYHNDVGERGGYWVIRESNPTHLFHLKFIFPLERPPNKVWSELRKITYREPHPVQPTISSLKDGRVLVDWKLRHLGQQNSHILKWEW